MSTASAYQHPGRKKQRRGILRSTFTVEETKEKYVKLRPFTFVTFNELMQMYIFLQFNPQNVFKNLLLFQ